MTTSTYASSRFVAALLTLSALVGVAVSGCDTGPASAYVDAGASDSAFGGDGAATSPIALFPTDPETISPGIDSLERVVPTSDFELSLAEDPCTSDADCAPRSPCHATECVARGHELPSDGAICTLDCRPGTIDCGGGCLCQAGHCAASHRVWTAPRFPSATE